jgi:hypothetical protein
MTVPNANSFDKGAFHQQLPARTHELDVRDTDVGDDGHIGRGDFRQRRKSPG